MDFAVLAVYRLKNKKIEKRDEYKDVAREL